MNFTVQKPSETEGEAMVRTLQAGGHEIDRKLEHSSIQLYKGAAPLTGQGDKFDLAYQNGLHSDDSEDDDASQGQGSSQEGDFCCHQLTNLRAMSRPTERGVLR